MGNLVQGTAEAALHPAAQGTTYAAASWAIFGFTVQEVAAVVAIVFGLLQIGLAVERRWFSKRRDRRSGE